MKARIIADQGYYRPQYKSWFGWNDIWYKGCRRFLTDSEAVEAINALMYPEGKVLYEEEK